MNMNTQGSQMGSNLILRELTISEIKALSNRRGVKQLSVEDFLTGIGGVSIDAAYKSLSSERKTNKWNLRTIQAVSDGIVLATTRCK